MTDEELRALVAENSLANRELRESVVALRATHAELREESDRRWREIQEEIRASRRELDRALTSMSRTVEIVSRDIGRFHSRFGDYTEALCRPSLTHTLRERFRMTEIAPQVRAFRNGDAIEIDMLAHANNELNEVYVAEIKTHLRQEGVEQILDHLRIFPDFFPEHRGKKLYGILAAVEAPEVIRKTVFREGLYLMLVAGDVLEMRVPEGFEPRAFPTA